MEGKPLSSSIVNDMNFFFIIFYFNDTTSNDFMLCAYMRVRIVQQQHNQQLHEIDAFRQ